MLGCAGTAEFSAGVRAAEPSLIHLKEAGSKHLTSPKLGILELQSHSWPSEKPPSLTLRSSARESDASRPKSYKSATGLELLESRAVMQSFGNHRLRCSKTRLAVPVVPPISLALKNAMCRLSERENISLARRFQQQVLDILMAIKIENTVWWW